MYIVILNPQGNFDASDSYWTEHPDFGGQLVYVKELAHALINKGHEVDIITRQIKDPEWPEFSEKEEVYPGTKLRIIRIPFGGYKFLRKERLWSHIPEYAEGIIRFFISENKWPDFITTHYGDGGITGVMLKEATGIPFSFTAHSLGAQKLDKMNILHNEFEDMNSQYAFATRIKAERLTMQKASIKFVSTSQEKLNQYRHALYNDIFEKEDSGFFIAPPGVNQKLFYFEEQDFEKLQVVKRRDLEENRINKPMIIASSRLDPKKNVIGLVNAYANSSELQEKSNLLLAVRGSKNPYQDIAGLKEEEKSEMKKILAMIRCNNLKGKIAFIQLNSQKELASCYRALASHNGVFSLTSLYEPFGLATIEAMACGLPVVVTSNGGGQEILTEDFETFGLLADPENPVKIAEKLLILLKQPEKWNYFHQQGLKRVKERYTWQATAKTYEAAISEVLASNNKSKSILDKKPDFSQYQSWLTNPTREMIDFIKSNIAGKEGKD
ncbi:MAG: glycosyltransferase family 1 protein [Tindallia sp. MSAO_Bac2]|nr:MAG: glycosyltransferase family 1 protein [Tindallia sp. MSAO_Bac2]